MKTKILLLALVLAGLIHFQSRAQWSTSGNDIYSTNSGNVGIGTTSPSAKLDIIGPGSTSAYNLTVKNEGSNVLSVYGTGNAEYYMTAFTGFRSRGSLATPSSLQAADRIATFGANGYINGAYRGVAAIEMFAGSTPGASSYPGYMVFQTTPNNGTSRLERMRINESGNVGIGTSNPSASYLLDVNGHIRAISVSQTSDKRFKRDIRKITGSLDKISQIAGYTYFFNTDKFKEKNFPSGEQMGVLAQEIQKIFPNSVIEDAEGYLNVDYISLIPVMIEAINTLKLQVDKALENDYTQKVLSTDKNDIQTYKGAHLNQNTPNPFSSNTSIEYIIPDNALSSRIIIYDLNGKQIEQFEISSRGAGKIDISSKEIVPGLYLYTLVLDGKPILTKKMIMSN